MPPLRSNSRDEGEMESFPIIGGGGGVDIDFADFNEDLLNSIDFDLFIGIDDGDILPDLEMDPEIFCDFSGCSGGDCDNGLEELSELTKSASIERVDKEGHPRSDDDDEKSSGIGLDSSSKREEEGEETVKSRHEATAPSSSPNEARQKGRKSSAKSKSSHGKRKVKVIFSFFKRWKAT